VYPTARTQRTPQRRNPSGESREWRKRNKDFLEKLTLKKITKEFKLKDTKVQNVTRKLFITEIEEGERIKEQKRAKKIFNKSTDLLKNDFQSMLKNINELFEKEKKI